MSLRLMVTFQAKPGKGEELAKAWLPRLAEVQREPGCEQYEVFRSIQRPDTIVLLERWTDAASLDAHSAMNRAREPIGADLREGGALAERFEV